MGATFEVVSVFTDTEDTRLAGISDFEITIVNGLPVLLVGSEAESAVTSFSLADPGMPLEITQIDYSEDSGTLVLTGFATYEYEGLSYAVTMGRYDDNHGLYRIDDTGAMIFEGSFAPEYEFTAYGRTAVTVDLGDEVLFVSSVMNKNGLHSFKLRDDGSISKLTVVWDRYERHLEDVVDMELSQAYGKNTLAVASALDAGIHLLSVAPGGAITLEADYGPGSGLGFNAISDLEFVTAKGKPYLVVASAGTDSLHVLRFKSSYKLKEKDSYIDTAETRFEGVSTIETFSYGDRSFVAAAGSDEGVTLFEIDWQGQLVLLDVITDGFDTALANISEMEVRLIDNMAYVYVASSGDNGFTVLSVDLQQTGDYKKGNKKSNIINGAAGDDTIWGKNGKDKLKGFQGDDRLIDGRGRDELTGGSGADVFVFEPDPKKDWIMDFEPDIDRIDLSAYDNTWHVSSLKFSDRDDGSVVITVGGDKIHVVARDGYEIDALSFSQDDFIFG